MAAVQARGTSILMENFVPDIALDTIERFGVTHAQRVPAVFVPEFL